MASIPAYRELVELIARLNPALILSYKTTGETLERVQELVSKQSAGTLSVEEESELRYFIYLENMLGLAKARAYEISKAA